MVLRKMHNLASSPWQIATAQLLIGAIFFAMRSCEYLETNTHESNRRTRITRLKNFVFRRDGKTIAHDDPNLTESNIVIVTFEFQKNDKRDVSIHMFRTNDPVLNPVVAWASAVQRIRSYPGATEHTKICAILSPDGKSIISIQNNHVRDHLRVIVHLIGEDKLGFTKDEIGLHSIRSGGAMAMFLSHISTIIIQRVGRWSSEAFLEYIREQVESFTAGVSQKMLEFENYFALGHNKPATTTPNESTQNNENGKNEVGLDVTFSELALNNSAELTRKSD